MVQRELYRMRWTRLRPIQVDAIFAFNRGAEHLILSAATASGKTEAAFLPILSELVSTRETGIGALYVGPLKALINDQFGRLEILCEAADIPVFKWHGDVDASKKRRFLSDPAGILLITPESIESLFINHSSQLPSLFRSIPFIVIDEIHAFIGTERGMHLKSLIARIAQISTVKTRIIGLSATLGDSLSTQRWLAPGDPESVRVISETELEKDILFRVKGYLFESNSEGEEHDDPALIKLSEDIIKHFYGKNSLIFINSRSYLELYANQVKKSLERIGLPDLFMVHHGSLSRDERERTEMALRSGRPTATFCSSTLELGIDVGDISRIGQIGAPWSVHSLCQRLGRSGRREGDPSVMIMFIPETEKKEMDLVDRLYPTLLRALALSELMLKRWYEPPKIGLPHYSTLVQQILSVIAERGGASAATLYHILVEKGAFPWVTRSEFASILRCMGESDLVEQDPEGLLIFGLRGERIVHSVDFYACFPTQPEIKVLWKNKLIGSITPAPGLEAQKYLILAGQRWEITLVDQERNEILVQPSRGGKVPYFSGGAASDIHPIVVQEIRDLLRSDVTPIYLDTQGTSLLSSARATARSGGVLEYDLIPATNGTYWFPWVGSAALRTLATLGCHWGNLEVMVRDIALFFHHMSPSEVIDFYTEVLSRCPPKSEIAWKYEDRAREKYDPYVPAELLVKGFAETFIDTAVVPPRTVAPSDLGYGQANAGKTSRS